MDYSLLLINADGSLWNTHLSTAKGIFNLKSDNCNINLRGDLHMGEWVIFIKF